MILSEGIMAVVWLVLIILCGGWFGCRIAGLESAAFDRGLTVGHPEMKMADRRGATAMFWAAYFINSIVLISWGVWCGVGK